VLREILNAVVRQRANKRGTYTIVGSIAEDRRDLVGIALDRPDPHRKEEDRAAQEGREAGSPTMSRSPVNECDLDHAVPGL
jgi:hypothetical protein